jgi:low affinity Fe/Cu permease
VGLFRGPGAAWYGALRATAKDLLSQFKPAPGANRRHSIAAYEQAIGVGGTRVDIGLSFASGSTDAVQTVTQARDRRRSGVWQRHETGDAASTSAELSNDRALLYLMRGPIRAPREKFMTKTFAEFANWVAVASGHPIVFGFATLTVGVWLVSGPFFSYSDTWQLVMNTWTDVATFFMVFLIQNSQNRDSSAIQAKLDELIRTSAARNSLVGIEKLTPEDIDRIRQSVETLAQQRSETSRS